MLGTSPLRRLQPNEIARGRLPAQLAHDPDPEASLRLAGLPYRVLVWDRNKQAIERLLAVASSASIGYATFYAAAREFPDRYLVLMHEGQTLTQWQGHGPSTA